MIVEPSEASDGVGEQPLQPTGSGVADLEMAYEQMKLAEANADDAGVGTDLPPAATAEAEAHPS